MAEGLAAEVDPTDPSDPAAAALWAWTPVLSSTAIVKALACQKMDLLK
jgi:hypothetical protein